jgi:hypothetical protein
MEPELLAELRDGLRRALAAVGLAGDRDAENTAWRWLLAYVRGAGRYDRTLVALRWAGPPAYTGFDLSQLALLAGVALRRPPALELWDDFRGRTAADLLAALAGQGGPNVRLVQDYVAREFAAVVAEADAGAGAVHCLEWAYQNLFHAYGREPPGPLPAGWHFGLTCPPRLRPGQPFLPTAADLDGFVAAECKRHGVLRAALAGLGQVEVGFQFQGRRLTALELLYLRYRSSPAAVPRDTPTAAELAALMNDAGCTAALGGLVTPAILDQVLSRDVRCRAQRHLDEARQRGELRAPAGRRWEALTRPADYVWGNLFRLVPQAQGGGR